MKSKLSYYNYAFVFYDVNVKRVQRVFKVCKKYLSHYQKSVFRGEMSPSKLIRFKKDLNKVIDMDCQHFLIHFLFGHICKSILNWSHIV